MAGKLLTVAARQTDSANNRLDALPVDQEGCLPDLEVFMERPELGKVWGRWTSPPTPKEFGEGT